MASIDTPDDQLIAVNYGDYEPDDWASKHQISLSELATRLGAKQHYDNRGRQIWTDSAESTVIQWIISNAGGATQARVNTCAWSGEWCVRQNHPAAGIPNCSLEKYFYSPETGQYGIEAAVSMDRTDFDRVILMIIYSDGVDNITAAVRIDGTTGNISYYNDVGAYVNIGGNVCLRSDIHYWHKLKLVVDIDLGEYIRILVDGIEYPLPGIPLNAFGVGMCENIRALLMSRGGGVNIQNIHWDDFIYTHLEP